MFLFCNSGKTYKHLLFRLKFTKYLLKTHFKRLPAKKPWKGLYCSFHGFKATLLQLLSAFSVAFLKEKELTLVDARCWPGPKRS